MTTLQLIYLAMIQGLTEFLPVSSSGHLILFSKFSGFADQGIAIDIALHIGSLLAVLIYFHKTIGEMICGLFKTALLPDLKNYGNRLSYLILIASVPALLIGFLLRNFGTEFLRNQKLIGWTILLYGLLLYISDKKGKNLRTTADISIKDAILIGFAQCLALIPGTSRSGITITIARFLGINRSEAAKFSMLLSVPTIFAAGALEVWRLYHLGDISQLLLSVDAVIYSFIASIFVIFVMMKWLKKATFLPFVIYRIVLGVGLLLYSYGFF